MKKIVFSANRNDNAKKVYGSHFSGKNAQYIVSWDNSERDFEYVLIDPDTVKLEIYMDLPKEKT
jgi:hypothetical protein